MPIKEENATAAIEPNARHEEDPAVGIEIRSYEQLKNNAVLNPSPAIEPNDAAGVAILPPHEIRSDDQPENDATEICSDKDAVPNTLAAIESNGSAGVAITPPDEVCSDDQPENDAMLNSLAAIESNGAAGVAITPQPETGSDGQPKYVAASNISNIDIGSGLSVATAVDSLVEAFVAFAILTSYSNASQNTANERERDERGVSNLVSSTLIGNGDGNVAGPAFGSITLSDISSTPLTMSTNTALAMAEIDLLD